MSKRSRPSITATPPVAPSARMTLKDRQTKASIDQFECARSRRHGGCSIRWRLLLQDALDLPARDAHLVRNGARPGPVGLERLHPRAVDALHPALILA